MRKHDACASGLKKKKEEEEKKKRYARTGFCSERGMRRTLPATAHAPGCAPQCACATCSARAPASTPQYARFPHGRKTHAPSFAARSVRSRSRPGHKTARGNRRGAFWIGREKSVAEPAVQVLTAHLHLRASKKCVRLESLWRMRTTSRGTEHHFRVPARTRPAACGDVATLPQFCRLTAWGHQRQLKQPRCSSPDWPRGGARDRGNNRDALLPIGHAVAPETAEITSPLGLLWVCTKPSPARSLF